MVWRRCPLNLAIEGGIGIFESDLSQWEQFAVSNLGDWRCGTSLQGLLWKLSLGSGRFSEYRLEGLVHDIIKQHEEVVGGSKVSSTQLVRLVRMLVDHQHISSESAPSPAPMLPQADYNRVSETQLKQVKHKMDLVFEQNIIRPDLEGYQYDKQVDFQAATEVSDWDD
ncbi:hypothetical protein PF008_g12483 [Phytophthora fragariae]|uniref:Centrosomal protein of 19 kDa n=1 Tax=Phytophthora fragariae TaxID=53985 RepID=A0A6G0RP54_9STRA|nr:hypothetical protein PF008_g12483 [Phytophthora fragariae]